MPEDTKTTETRKSKSGLVIVVVAVVCLVSGGGAAWYFLHPRNTAEAAVDRKVAEYTVHLESFTVNLSDPEESHFLRITMDLGLGHALKGEPTGKAGESDFPTARTRDTILSVLTACKADGLLTPEGKAQLKHELLQSLQQNVPEIDVRDVYFTEFLVQR